MKHSMLHPVHEQAGLGSPPDAFYTNASESVNSIIKAYKVQYKCNELPQFIAKLNELAEDQQREVEKSVISTLFEQNASIWKSVKRNGFLWHESSDHNT